MGTRRKWVLVVGILIGICLLIWQRESVKVITYTGITSIIRNF